jgi:hypothetical protein
LSYGSAGNWNQVQEKPVKRWIKSHVDGYPETHVDVLINPKGEKNYCSVVLKEEFRKTLLTSRNPLAKKQDSLFNF